MLIKVPLGISYSETNADKSTTWYISCHQISSTCIYIYTVAYDGAVVIVWWLGLQLPMQSVPITIKVKSSNLAHDGVYSIQHYFCQ